MSVKTGFDHIAGGYDKTFTETATGRRQRAIVHNYLKYKFFAQEFDPARQTPVETRTPISVLELNCGTGEDALWLARHGAQVLATDIAPEMVAIAAGKAARAGLAHLIRTETLDIRRLCPPTFHHSRAGENVYETLKSFVNVKHPDVENLPARNKNKELINGKFDLILSNFGGLNCLSPEELNTFGAALPALLKPGGLFVAIVMGRFCCWETLYFLLKGRWRNAFRRLGGGPLAARLDRHATVPVWYYSPGEFRRFFPALEPVTIQPVGCWLPPSYLDPLVAHRPRLMEILDFTEQKCRGRLWAWGADHFMLAGSFLK